MKSTYSKWKRCSHICLLTFLLKRGGGLGGVSVPLKVDWSVPALKSCQSVSATVWCLVWWTWWTCYCSVLVMVEFLQYVCGISIFCVNITVVCFIHITFMVLYLYEWNSWAALLFKCCYVQGYVVAYFYLLCTLDHIPTLLYSTLQSDRTWHMSPSLDHRCCG